MGINPFSQVLIELLQGNRVQYDDMATRFREAFLAFGSETPDNVNAAQHIDYGIARDYLDKKIVGLRLQHKHVLISEILNTFEGTPIPSEVKNYYPDITEEEWHSITRLATMVFIAFESEITDIGNSE